MTSPNTISPDKLARLIGRPDSPLLIDVRLAAIVRGADAAPPELAPESAGLLAAGLALHDAFYRWCRDAVDEGHDWPPTARKS